MLAFYFHASNIRTGFGRKNTDRERRREGGGTRMTLWREVTKAAMTAGCAEGGSTLNAFDNALLAAGIGNINLVKVSSIVPPDVDFVPLPSIKPGAIVPTAYAAITSDVPNEMVTAAVGYALPVDRTKPGVIMEFHDRADRATAEQAIRAMLGEAFEVRGEAIREMKVVAVDHRVEKVGCALAAVTLLSEDDIL
jgi:arginine decarboxylase